MMQVPRRYPQGGENPTPSLGSRKLDFNRYGGEFRPAAGFIFELYWEGMSPSQIVPHVRKQFPQFTGWKDAYGSIHHGISESMISYIIGRIFYQEPLPTIDRLPPITVPSLDKLRHTAPPESARAHLALMIELPEDAALRGIWIGDPPTMEVSG
jgi:hypothetical protein